MVSRRCFNAVWLALVAVGCSGFGRGGFSYEYETPTQTAPTTATMPLPSGVGAFSPMVDNSPVVKAEVPPPAVSGGTLLVTSDGMLAVAADPDRDRVSIVDLAQHAVVHTVDLGAGDEPGRVVEDDAGLVHVALRRGGAVVSIDVASGTIVSRRPVCGAPRGIAFDAASKDLQVACADGTLVTLPSAGGDVSRRISLGVDLRDVVVTPTGLVVSRFKSAELLTVTANGDVIATSKAQGVQRLSDTMEGPLLEPVEADGAWRTIGAPNGDIVMLHQYALAAPIKIGQTSTVSDTGIAPYGVAMGGCSGLVQPAVSTLDPSGTFRAGMPLAAPILAIDAAVSPDGLWVALAHAGLSDQGTVTLTALGDVTATTVDSTGCAHPTGSVPVVGGGRIAAVAFSPTVPAQDQTRTWFVVQTRDPAQIVQFHDPMGAETYTVSLGGRSVVDTGHEIFHTDTGAGIACASCHLEGAEDGRVWKFDTIGDRRTQSVNVGLGGTEPFHWDGDMQDLGALVHEVFVRRMGGPEESAERVSALGSWLDSLRPNAPIVDVSSDAALRGKALFESAAVGCVTCHSGSKHTSNQNAYVGTTEVGHSLQVPSLVGVGYRAPFLHNGCAATLRDRFDPACGGGDEHGHTSALTSTQIDDLVQYLESL